MKVQVIRNLLDGGREVAKEFEMEDMGRTLFFGSRAPSPDYITVNRDVLEVHFSGYGSRQPFTVEDDTMDGHHRDPDLWIREVTE